MTTRHTLAAAAFIIAAGFSSAQNCSNIGFDSSAPGSYTNSTAITGWSLTSRATSLSCSSPLAWVAGCSEFSVMATPIMGIPGIGTLPNSPLGGSLVAVMNNTVGNYSSARLTKTIAVTNAAPIVNCAFAFYVQDGGSAHGCCEQARCIINVRDTLGNMISCLSTTIDPSVCHASSYNYTLASGYLYSGWQGKSLNLSGFIGSSVVLEIIASDCDFGGHSGRLFFDANCGTTALYGNTLAGNTGGSVSFCAGSTQAIITAPQGMTSYSWAGPSPVPAGQASLSAITVSNATTGQAYSVTMTSTAGCVATAVYTLAYSSVGPGTYSVKPACSNGAGGTATLYPTGSGTGYNYVWLNASSSVVATVQSPSSLPAGNYTVQVSSTPGCGTVLAYVTVPVFSLTPSISAGGPVGGCVSYTSGAFVWFNQAPPASFYTFSWSPSTFLGSTNTQSVSIMPSAAPGSSAGVTYSVLITPTSYPQCAETKTITFSVGDPPTPTLQPISKCRNDTTVVIPAIPAGGTFVSGWPGLSAGGMLTPSQFTPGSYTYTYSITWGGCTAQSANSITVLAVPNLQVTGNTSLCAGSSGTLQASGASGYSWTGGPASATFIVSPQVNTVYSVTGTSSLTGCSAGATATVQVYPVPAISISGPDTVCAGATFTLLASGAASYLWQNNTTTSVVSLSFPTGQHQFSVTGFSGPVNCQDSATHSIHVLSQPTVQLTGNDAICEGQTLTLTATGAQSYSWSHGATVASVVITPSVGGVWWVSGINGQLCEDLLIFSITVDDCTALFSDGSLQYPVLFPNPAHDFVNFRPGSDGLAQLFDVNGRLVQSYRLQGSDAGLSITELPQGVYYLRFSSGGRDAYYRIVKN